MMRRVVLDTNLYLSGILFNGVPADLLIMASHGAIHVLISHHILREIENKLLTKFQRDPAIVRWELQQLRSITELVLPDDPITICRDPDDNRVLECAVTGRADTIVTGDKDLLTLNPYKDIRIVTAREFLDRHVAASRSI